MLFRSTVMYPEQRHYYVQNTTTMVASIEMHYGSNILVHLGQYLGANKWSIRIQIRPLVNFVWLAALIMAIGGAIAASDRRYRIAKSADEAAKEAATSSPLGEGA